MFKRIIRGLSCVGDADDGPYGNGGVNRVSATCGDHSHNVDSCTPAASFSSSKVALSTIVPPDHGAALGKSGSGSVHGQSSPEQGQHDNASTVAPLHFHEIGEVVATCSPFFLPDEVPFISLNLASSNMGTSATAIILARLDESKMEPAASAPASASHADATGTVQAEGENNVSNAKPPMPPPRRQHRLRRAFTAVSLPAAVQNARYSLSPVGSTNAGKNVAASSPQNSQDGRLTSGVDRRTSSSHSNRCGSHRNTPMQKHLLRSQTAGVDTAELDAHTELLQRISTDRPADDARRASSYSALNRLGKAKDSVNTLTGNSSEGLAAIIEVPDTGIRMQLQGGQARAAETFTGDLDLIQHDWRATALSEHFGPSPHTHVRRYRHDEEASPLFQSRITPNAPWTGKVRRRHSRASISNPFMMGHSGRKDSSNSGNVETVATTSAAAQPVSVCPSDDVVQVAESSGALTMAGSGRKKPFVVVLQQRPSANVELPVSLPSASTVGPRGDSFELSPQPSGEKRIGSFKASVLSINSGLPSRFSTHDRAVSLDPNTVQEGSDKSAVRRAKSQHSPHGHLKAGSSRTSSLERLRQASRRSVANKNEPGAGQLSGVLQATYFNTAARDLLGVNNMQECDAALDMHIAANPGLEYVIANLGDDGKEFSTSIPYTTYLPASRPDMQTHAGSTVIPHFLRVQLQYVQLLYEDETACQGFVICIQQASNSARQNHPCKVIPSNPLPHPLPPSLVPIESVAAAPSTVNLQRTASSSTSVSEAISSKAWAGLLEEMQILHACVAHSPSIVTVMTLGGQVLYQNGSSIAFMGLRTADNLRRPVSITDERHLLSILFHHDAVSPGSMLAAVQSGQDWEGLVRISADVKNIRPYFDTDDSCDGSLQQTQTYAKPAVKLEDTTGNLDGVNNGSLPIETGHVVVAKPAKGLLNDMPAMSCDLEPLKISVGREPPNGNPEPENDQRSIPLMVPLPERGSIVTPSYRSTNPFSPPIQLMPLSWRSSITSVPPESPGNGGFGMVSNVATDDDPVLLSLQHMALHTTSPGGSHSNNTPATARGSAEYSNACKFYAVEQPLLTSELQGSLKPVRTSVGEGIHLTMNPAFNQSMSSTPRGQEDSIWTGNSAMTNIESDHVPELPSQFQRGTMITGTSDQQVNVFSSLLYSSGNPASCSDGGAFPDAANRAQETKAHFQRSLTGQSGPLQSNDLKSSPLPFFTPDPAPDSAQSSRSLRPASIDFGSRAAYSMSGVPTRRGRHSRSSFDFKSPSRGTTAGTTRDSVNVYGKRGHDFSPPSRRLTEKLNNKLKSGRERQFNSGALSQATAAFGGTQRALQLMSGTRTATQAPQSPHSIPLMHSPTFNSSHGEHDLKDCLFTENITSERNTANFRRSPRSPSSTGDRSTQSPVLFPPATSSPALKGSSHGSDTQTALTSEVNPEQVDEQQFMIPAHRGDDQAQEAPNVQGATVHPEDDMSVVWHDLKLVYLEHGIAGKQPVIIIVQHDVSGHVRELMRASRILDQDHRLLESIFPAHIVQDVLGEMLAGTYFPPAEDPKLAQRNSVANPDQPVAPTLVNGRQTFAAAVLRAHQQQKEESQGGPVRVGRSPRKTRNLPHQILQRHHPVVTILFADIKDFTSMSQQVEPTVVMTFLHELFSLFDSLVDRHGVYKVETIGDCYMVAGGLVRQAPDGTKVVTDPNDPDHAEHANKVIAFAQDMLEVASTIPMPVGTGPVQLRVGIHTGECMSGLVGRIMPRFCLFGDTVNTASRCESTGRPKCIQVSEATWECLGEVQRSDARWRPTGGVTAKGKGRLQTYLWSADVDVLEGALASLMSDNAPPQSPVLPELKPATTVKHVVTEKNEGGV